VIKIMFEIKRSCRIVMTFLDHAMFMMFIMRK